MDLQIFSLARAPSALPIWPLIYDDLGCPTAKRVARTLGMCRASTASGCLGSPMPSSRARKKSSVAMLFKPRETLRNQTQLDRFLRVMTIHIHPATPVFMRVARVLQGRLTGWSFRPAISRQ